MLGTHSAGAAATHAFDRAWIVAAVLALIAAAISAVLPRPATHDAEPRTARPAPVRG